MKAVDRSKQPGVKISQILLERVTFAHRDDYLSTTASPTPDAVVGTVNVEVQSGLSESGKNGLVRLRVKTLPENRPFYEFDVAMVALFAVDEAAPNMSLEQYAHVAGATLLYPFMRQVVADLTLRGRFGPVWLNPINVATLAPPTKGESRAKGNAKGHARKTKQKKLATARSARARR